MNKYWKNLGNRNIWKSFARVREDKSKDPLAVLFVHYMNDDQETGLDWAERCLEEKEASSCLFNADVFYTHDMLNPPRFIELKKKLKF